jgi:hypothetical protein
MDELLGNPSGFYLPEDEEGERIADSIIAVLSTDESDDPDASDRS